MKSLPGAPQRPIGTAPGSDPIRTIELELLTLTRNLETLGRRSALYDRVDRAGYVALRALDRMGPVPTRVLADALSLDASTVTRQVTVLVGAGLVERRANPTDGRSSDLSVTQLGRQVMRDVERARHQVLTDLFAHWSEADRLALGRALTQLNLTLVARVAELCAPQAPEQPR